SNLKTPEQFTPAITQGVSFGTTSAASWVQESFRDVLTAIKSQQDVISQEINQKKSLLSKITNNIYNYVLNLNLQFKFEDITESAFQKIKNNVDKILQKQCPNTIKQFLAAYKRLESDNFEEWSQAMSSCRNILKEFANSVFPAQPQNYKKSDGEEIEVTDDKYKNRIIAFIDKTPAGRRTKQFTENRVHALNNILSDGAKNEIKKQDANICVLETYLVIASLIRLMTN
ncbi:MAG: hypothetical protein Q7R33_01615, partial [Nitrosarchaeum sp.]|nr:hypothetical protein [Nitrosarchaeum sp.]